MSTGTNSIVTAPATTPGTTEPPTTPAPTTTTTTTEPTTNVPATPPPTRPAAVPASTAATLLATLNVEPAAPMTGYSRDQFGPAWADVDHNGCDTRNDILNRDLTSKSWKAGTHDCVVMSGTLADPYTGRSIVFTKSDADAVQIDHVVALADAWQTGAATWSATARERYANDPLVLLAVDGPTNQSKGDGDASEWLPPNSAYRCAYVTRQVEIKTTYKLWVTPTEHAAMATVLSSCPGTAPAATTTTAPPVTAPPVTPAPPVTAAPNVYYPNCTAAKAAGVTPLHIGDPGYRPGLDRDRDGIACES